MKGSGAGVFLVLTVGAMLVFGTGRHYLSLPLAALGIGWLGVPARNSRGPAPE